ncbi:MAG: class I SAM-dependent methyltransferase [Bacteroidia bacterium]|nr:class I SAM-dependent methyltransferase [Bacteroidia bacterium]
MENNIYNPDFVKGLFNRMSASYERVNYITSFGFSLRWRKQYIASFVSTNEKVQAIDLLTGMGETWRTTKQKLPNATITALDFSEGMLNYANNKNKQKFNSEINIIIQDVLNNQLPDNHFDFVTCAFGLKTFNEEQIKKLAQETKRILKPGGQFSFIEVSKPENFILQKLYGLYIGKMVPLLGRLLLGNPVEYRMLWRYTQEFGNARRASEIFKNAGLNAGFDSYFWGCATGISGSKV